MLRQRRLAYVLLSLGCLLLLPGCSDLLGQLTGQGPGKEAAATPELPAEWLSTPSASVRVVASRACNLAAWYTLRTDEPQGDLIAWSPDGSRLAFAARQDKNAWYVGDLAIASGEDFQTLEEPTLTVNAFGDLDWSPDGSRLAFVALRPDDQTYTIAVYTPGSPLAVDLFPDDTVHTNQWSSPKGIADWIDDRRLLACLQCGPGCEETAEIDLDRGYRPAAAQTPGEHAPLVDLKVCLTPALGQPAAQDGLFPADAAVSWSPDGAWAAYIDSYGSLWIYQAGPHAVFFRETASPVQEVKWSPGSQYLAIRTEEQVFVDRIGCP